MRSRTRQTLASVAAGAVVLAWCYPDRARLLVDQAFAQAPAWIFIAAAVGVSMVMARYVQKRRGRTRRRRRLGDRGPAVPFAPRIFKTKGHVTLRKGAVYVLTNAAMPGLVKIGSTSRDASVRSLELSGTNTAVPFEIAYELVCDHAQQVEIQAHRLLAAERTSGRREFFTVSVSRAVQAITSARRHVTQIAGEREII